MPECVGGSLSFSAATDTGIYWHGLCVGFIWHGHGFEFHLGEAAVWLAFLAIVFSLMKGKQ